MKVRVVSEFGLRGQVSKKQKLENVIQNLETTVPVSLGVLYSTFNLNHTHISYRFGVLLGFLGTGTF